MSLFSKLFGNNSKPKKRIRICVECGMPIEEHKDWCSILRGQKAMAERSAGSTSAP
jgi:hypothetical protein